MKQSMKCALKARWLGVSLAGAALALLTASGCGRGGAARIPVSGKVTWHGEPIPRGMVSFDPDVTKKNSGPQGFAPIVDGRYDTRAEKGKGSVVGPQIVIVKAF